MDSHRFVPAPPRIHVRKKQRTIFRAVRDAGDISNQPDLESMTFTQQLVAMSLAGKRSSIATTIFRDDVGQLARRHRDYTMGINGKYLLHALDAGSVEETAAEVFGMDVNQSKVFIDPELSEIALDEAFEKISNAARSGAKIIFACSRPSATLAMFIDLAALAHNAGATVLDSFSPTSGFVADGRRGRHLSWFSGVAVMTDDGSIVETNDAKAGEELLFHLPRPDLVVADHIFAGAALTNGFPTVAFTGLKSLAVAVASVPEKQCLAVPIDLSQPASHYSVITNYAKTYFE